MSGLSGDKSRFNAIRKRRTAQRAKLRELRAQLIETGKMPAPDAKPVASTKK
jgi:hypothetical protein